MDPYLFDDGMRTRGGGVIAGVDEAGRGPLAGPVVAAAVVLPEGLRIKGVRDSKIIPERERQALRDEIAEAALSIGVGVVGVEEIERLNILGATRHAMHEAIARLTCRPDLILIDALTVPTVSIEQLPVIKGDMKSASIAAASIVAKVARDRIMLELHALYPHYGFDRHKGYATREHLQKIRQYGPCPLHRRGFKRVLSLELPLH